MNFEASWGASGENAAFAPPFDGKLPNGDSISNIGSGIPVKEFLFIRTRNTASQFDLLYSDCTRSALVVQNLLPTQAFGGHPCQMEGCLREGLAPHIPHFKIKLMNVILWMFWYATSPV